MYNSLVGEISEWINKKYLDWQYATGERQTLKAFAKYLDVKTTTLSSWLNDDIPPTGDNLLKLADRLGYEVFDVLGVEPPYPRVIHQAKAAYDALPSEQQPKFRQDLDQFIAEWLTAHGFKRVK